MKDKDPMTNTPVDVYNNQGGAIISTTRASRARRLLKNKKAVIHTKEPFSIRLLGGIPSAVLTTPATAACLLAAGGAANDSEHDPKTPMSATPPAYRQSRENQHSISD